MENNLTAEQRFSSLEMRTARGTERYASKKKNEDEASAEEHEIQKEELLMKEEEQENKKKQNVKATKEMKDWIDSQWERIDSPYGMALSLMRKFGLSKEDAKKILKDETGFGD